MIFRAHIEIRSSGRLATKLYALHDNGDISPPVSSTLADTISDFDIGFVDHLENLIRDAVSGAYQRNQDEACDTYANEKLIWVSEPEARRGYVVISNEWIDGLSNEDGGAITYSANTVLAVIEHWRRFNDTIQAEGMNAMVGKFFDLKLECTPTQKGLRID